MSNAIGYALYLGLTYFGIGPKLAMTLLYGVGVLQTFFFNKRWTFGHKGEYGPVLVRYCAAYGIGYAVNLLAFILLIDQGGLPHQLVQGVMIFFISGLLFLAQKYWVFPATSTSAIT
jgi:putative flippase GtrA